MRARDVDWEAGADWRAEATSLLAAIQQLSSANGSVPASGGAAKVGVPPGRALLAEVASAYLACDSDTWEVRIEVLQDVLFRTAYELDLQELPGLLTDLLKWHPGTRSLLREFVGDGFHVAGTLEADSSDYGMTPPVGITQAPAAARWLLQTAWPPETGHGVTGFVAVEQLVQASLDLLARLVPDTVFMRHRDDADIIADWAGDRPYRDPVPVRPVPWPTGPNPEPWSLAFGEPVAGVPANDRAWQTMPVVVGVYDEARLTGLAGDDDGGFLVRFVVHDGVHSDCTAVWSLEAP